MFGRSRGAAITCGVLIALSGSVVAAESAAAASPAATAFSHCMDGYLSAQRYALNARQDAAALAVLYTGYANCYYDLSQRRDLTDQQEINAINNYNRYQAMATQAIARAGLTYYKTVLKKFALRGLRL